jgi:cytidylate kinase
MHVRTETSLLLITIDGPAGAGKTTVSKMLAEYLDYRYLDTGALYRGVAYMAHQQHISAADDRGLSTLCESLRFSFSGQRLIVNGVDISERIRTPEISLLASAVSARPQVRRALLDVQRSVGRSGGLVAEGRDMGTVVFPRADLKFFLDATVEERAMRRFLQYGKEDRQTLAQIEADIRRRDENDSRRDIAPLKPADDAILVDSSTLTAEGVVAMMLTHVKRLTGDAPA